MMMICLEKAGTGIFLMKENAKLYKSHSTRKSHTLGKRLSLGTSQSEEQKMEGVIT